MTLGTVACQAPLSMGFSRQEHWSGLSFSPPGDLPDPGIETTSLMSPALQADSFPLEPLGKRKLLPRDNYYSFLFIFATYSIICGWFYVILPLFVSYLQNNISL